MILTVETTVKQELEIDLSVPIYYRSSCIIKKFYEVDKKPIVATASDFGGTCGFSLSISGSIASHESDMLKGIHINFKQCTQKDWDEFVSKGLTENDLIPVKLQLQPPSPTPLDRFNTDMDGEDVGDEVLRMHFLTGKE